MIATLMGMAALYLSRAQAAEPSPAAQAQRELVEAMDRAPAPPLAGFACVPTDRLLRELVGLAALMGALPEDDESRWMIEQLKSGEGMASLGFDPAGALSMVVVSGKDIGTLSVGFSGDGEKARALLAAMDLEPVPVDGVAAAWWVKGADGDRMLARLEGGRLDFAMLVTPSMPVASRAAPVGFDLDLLRGLPSGPGCAVHLVLGPADLPPVASARLKGRLELSGFVPFEPGELAVLRSRLPNLDAGFELVSGVAPRAVRSRVAPTLVLHTGFSAAEALALPGVGASMGLKPAQARRVSALLNIGPGAQVGVFGDPRQGDVVVELPLDPALGPTAPRPVGRRVVRLARKLGFRPVYRAPEAIGLQRDGRLVHVQLRPERLVLGTDAQRVLEVAMRLGDPWLDETSAAMASAWPLSLRLRSAGEGGATVDIGLRVQGGVAELGLGLHGADGKPGLQELAKAMGPRLFPPPGGGAEALEMALLSIAVAQESWMAEHGRYLELPSAPRRLAELDEREVPWIAGDAWTSFGWQPDEGLRGAIFWVETDPGGQTFTAYAAWDQDGDGVPVMMRLRAGGQPERLSGPPVR